MSKEDLEKKMAVMEAKASKLEKEIQEKRNQVALLNKDIYIKGLEIKVAEYEGNDDDGQDYN
jgi:hypothetical protein